RRRPLAVRDRRHERDADVPLAARAEIGARRDDDTAAEQPLRALLRALARRYLCPEVHGRLAAGDAPAEGIQRTEHDLALVAVDVAHARDVLLVPPRDDRRALHELPRCRPDGGTIGPPGVHP